MKILGISSYYHDSAASLIDNGKIIACAQEERFTRIKHDDHFPINAIQYCLNEGNIELNKIDHITFYDKPFLKFERLLETYIAFAPLGFKSFSMAMPVWLKEKLFLKKLLLNELKDIQNVKNIKNKLFFSEHHLSHAASAFYPSPFKNAVVLTMDGVGEWATTSVCIGNENKLNVLKEIHFPHSLGLLYSAATYYTGFKVNSGEYKVMGLAPYGTPKYFHKILENLIDVKEDGSYRMNQNYFNYCTGLTMTNDKFSSLFGRKVRGPNDELEQFHMDIASSFQKVTEHIVTKITDSLSKETGLPNLCLSGGVALNCVANGIVKRNNSFKNIWIQPASGDAGGALGAALYTHYDYLDHKRSVQKKDTMSGSYLGPSFSNKEIETILKKINANFEVKNDKELFIYTAHKLAEENVVGWFQGRMEFGPRALGNRSILGDPRSSKMQKNLNLKIKYRESFRPFAPSILAEDTKDWFQMSDESPYMLLVSEVSKNIQKEMTKKQQNLFGIDKLNVPRSTVPAITHVDFTARVQTVHKETNQRFHKLISNFKKITGCPILINTSFNVRGEPIVLSPQDAFKCFMGTEMDILVIGNFVLEKINQEKKLKLDYKNEFELD